MVLLDPQALENAAADLGSASARLDVLRASSVSSLFQLYRRESAVSVDRRLRAAISSLEDLRTDLEFRSEGGNRLQSTQFFGPKPADGGRTGLANDGCAGWQDITTRPGSVGPIDTPRNADHQELSAASLHAGADFVADLNRDAWTRIAHWEAGIDPTTWRPEQGFAANRSTVVAVYNFYASLYLTHSDFEWAAMANLVGPMFYAGWQDLSTLRQVFDPAERVRALGSVATSRGINLPASVTIGVADLAASELAWLETQLLAMQKQIFEDLAWMHVAFRYGGVEAVTRNVDDPALVNAWTDIASGEPARVRAGNLALLRREQSEIIQDDYDRIAHHNRFIGAVFADALTWFANAPFPGSRPYREVVTDQIEVIDVDGRNPEWWPPSKWLPLEFTTAMISTPRGHVTTFDDRWEWILEDLLPAYHELADDPARLRLLLERSVLVRALEQRTILTGQR